MSNTLNANGHPPIRGEEQPFLSGGYSLRECVLALAVVLAASVSAATAATPDAEEHLENKREAAEYRPDNTGRNARDADGNPVTADSQPLSGADNELLANIRKAVVENDKLSTYGKNVKIMVENGAVTLRGPVETSEEKSWIASTAKKLAPSHKLRDELEVATK